MTIAYDPLLAKLIAHGPTRDDAFDKLQRALAETVVEGVTTNLQFLRWLVTHPDVRAGRTTTAFLVHLRARQINGCSFCAEMHSRELKEAGEPAERIWTIAAWREAPYFTDAERAALALTEAVTRLSDRADPVPDDIWEQASRHYDEQAWRR